MIFKIDKQTIDDLGIFGKIRENSVYGIFNKTMTRGGAQILEEMFLFPLSDLEKINERGEIIRYFQNSGISFPFNSELFDSAEFYLSNTDSRSRLSAHEDNLERKFKNAIGTDTEYQLIQKGVLSMLEIINRLKSFLDDILSKGVDNSYQPQVDAMMELLNIKSLEPCLNETNYRKLSYVKTANYDQELDIILGIS